VTWTQRHRIRSSRRRVYIARVKHWNLPGILPEFLGRVRYRTYCRTLVIGGRDEDNRTISLRRRLHSLLKNAFTAGESVPQALKRGLIFSDLTARLKSCPSQDPPNRVFQLPRKPALIFGTAAPLKVRPDTNQMS
jgi:hypothetical protein